MEKLMKAVAEDAKITVMVKANVAGIEKTEKDGWPWFRVHFTHDGNERTMTFRAVVIATGGFGANKALLEKYAKETSGYATTNGPWSTGDGLSLGKSLGVELVDLEEVQLHPTGFVDPKDPDAGSKILAAEKLRGCGAILLNLEGRRFVDELNRRDHVYNKLSQQTDEKAWLLLSSEGGDRFNVSHMAFYMGRGLITAFQSLEALSEHTNIPVEILREELMKYNAACMANDDGFGKKTYPTQFDLDAPIFVAMITPVVHYTMGGLSFNHNAQLLSPDHTPIPGLYGAGEVTGGLHGKNRLGGNSLLDCVVFGRQAGSHAAQFIKQIPIHEEL